MEAEPRSLMDLEPGCSFVTQISFSPDDMAAFASLSGDRNPLHLDEGFARSRGFDGCVVYGGLIIARLSEVIGMHLPGRDGIWLSLKIDFRQPLYVGENAGLAAEVASRSEATGGISLSFLVTSGNRTIAKGIAESVVRSNG